MLLGREFRHEHLPHVLYLPDTLVSGVEISNVIFSIFLKRELVIKLILALSQNYLNFLNGDTVTVIHHKLVKQFDILLLPLDVSGIDVIHLHLEALHRDLGSEQVLPHLLPQKELLVSVVNKLYLTSLEVVMDLIKNLDNTSY